jgi:hypothetical protein
MPFCVGAREICKRIIGLKELESVVVVNVVGSGK